jgi:hypothetical protein
MPVSQRSAYNQYMYDYQYERARVYGTPPYTTEEERPMARETIADYKLRLAQLEQTREQERRNAAYQENMRQRREDQAAREDLLRKSERNDRARIRAAQRRREARDAAQRGEPSLTPALTAAMRPIWASQRLSGGMKILAERENEFSSRLAMNLTGIAMIPDARAAFDQALDNYWNGQIQLPPRECTEMVIGSGVTAAVYCAARVLSGFPMPAVVDASDRPGGVFAVSRLPSFRLNSPNRPGLGGVPGEDSALNYMPGAPIQPSDLSRAEFQDNTDIAWVVRATLALYGRVFPGVTVENYVAETGNRNQVSYRKNGELRYTYAGRVIDARGTGTPNPPERGESSYDGKMLLNFPQFMKRMDDPFPLRGMGRVAVIGSGDSAKCVIEALLGISPGLQMTPASLDTVPQIDWYSAGLPDTCEQWRERVRGRYGRIASYLPKNNGRSSRSRLRLMPTTATPVKSIGCVVVRDRTYDVAIMCTGSTVQPLNLDYDGSWSTFGNPRVARKLSGLEMYKAGPCAQLPFNDREVTSGVSDRPENATAMFRYTPKTAALGAMLPAAQMG